MISKTSPWLKFEIIGLFANTWTADYKYPVTDCENLSFLIQIQLSEKQNIFSEFLIQLMESRSNFEHFETKEDRHSYCISEISDGPRLGHATQYSALSQNMLRQSTCSTVPNTSKIFMRVLLAYFFITLTRNDLENIFIIEVWNDRVLCELMGCGLQVSCSGLWEFTVPYSNPVMLKIKRFSLFFIPFMESPSSFKYIQKKKKDRHS